ncbi:MAG: FAD-dependent oxidoreductase [bacterium]|nr:FAD-dependent oxidoreductase [bacterium]
MLRKKTSVDSIDYEVAIIGAGVAGMTAAIYLKRAGINCCIIEKDYPGGQINLSTKVENYPGFVQSSGIELSEIIFSQLKKLDVKYINDEVIETKLKGKIKYIVFRNQIITCKKVIISTGRHSRRLDITNAKELVGKGISYCATCDGNLFSNQDVCVIGGGNSAFEEALYLSKICNKVYIVNRTNILRAEEIYLDRVREHSNIEIMYNSCVNELKTKDGVLNSIVLTNTIDKENIRELDVKCCFVSIGYEPNTNVFCEIKMDRNGYIFVDEKCMTNIEGVYAAGDVVKKKIFQLITAMNDGVICAYDCIEKLRINK